MTAQSAGTVTAAERGRVRLPLWSWSYVTFRFGDGLSSSLIPLAIVLHYHQPLWALALATAVQNLASVPATFLWGTLMDRGIRRRPIVMTGFAVAGASMVLLATLPGFPVFVLGAVLYTVFGVATAPAASTMVLQKVPRSRWSRTTAALSRRTGTAFVTGMVTSILLTVPASWWAHLGALGRAVSGSVLVGSPHFSGQFAAAATMSAMAAVLAWQTVPSYQPPLPHEKDYDAKLVQASQRRFERPVYFPGRLRNLPTLKGLRADLRQPQRLWPIGYALTFMGSVCFFASYPGILANELLLAPGLVLLAQLPSNLVTPITYPWAGALGHRIGESRGVMMGAILRTLALPVFCLVVVSAGHNSSLPYIVLLLALHGAMGLSFALIQVNGPVLLAQLHPGGRGQGVGTYHAAVGAGTLLGSLSAFLLIRLADFRWSYVFAVAMAIVGGVTLWRAHLRTLAMKAAQPDSA